MKHPIIDKILTEWSYRVHDGMPDPKNPMHLIHLRETLQHLKVDSEVIDMMMGALNEDSDDSLMSKKAKQKGLEFIGFNKYKDSNGYVYVWDKKISNFTKTGKKTKAEPMGGDDKGGKDKKDVPQPPEGQQQNTDVSGLDIDDSGGFGVDGESEKTKEPDIENMSSDELRELDHQTTDKQLTLTNEEADAQAKKKGKKGVGAGTAASRAGEAAVHYAVRGILKGKPLEKIEEELMKIANEPGKSKKKGKYVLNEKWVKSAISTADYIYDTFKYPGIEEVVWDTPAGRALIDSEGHGTSADMFIKTKDGERVGISLKVDTNVFLVSGGYKTSHEDLTSQLSEYMEPEELKEFTKSTELKTYNDAIDKHMLDIGDVKENNQEFKKLVLERMKHYQSLSDEEIATKFNSANYIPLIRSNKIMEIFNDLPNPKTKSDLKLIVKVFQDKEFKKKFDFYDKLRNEDVNLTQSILQASQSNPKVAEGFRKMCLKGMHAEDILFGENPNLDKFVTVYGEKPAVELSKGTLLKIFGMEREYHTWQSMEDGSEKDNLKKQLSDDMANKLIIDIKDGAKAGEIKINHEEYGEFHLFGIKARAKGIGNAPTLEMYQTPFMGNVIKEGSTDIKGWTEKTRRNFVNSMVKQIKEDLIDASTEQREELEKEIEKLRAIL